MIKVKRGFVTRGIIVCLILQMYISWLSPLPLGKFFRKSEIIVFITTSYL